MQNITDIIKKLEQLKQELKEVEEIAKDETHTEQYRLKIITERIHALTMKTI